MLYVSRRLALGLVAVFAGSRRALAQVRDPLFDRQLVELRAYAPTPDIKATYNELDGAWSAYKVQLVGAPASKGGADAVMTSAGRILRLANQGTTQFEAAIGKPIGKLVNVSGRQRMLSQQAAAMYLSASWGVQRDASIAALRTARSEFAAAHASLESAAETTPAIRAELDLAKQQFAFFDSALQFLETGSVDAHQQADVFTTSERILQVMEVATEMYARLG